MPWLLVVAGAAVLLLALSVTWGRRPAVHRATAEDLDEFIRTLLRRGHDGGILLIEEDLSSFRQRRFIQFSKYIAGPGRYGVELAFPCSPWSEGYFPTLRATLDEWGLPYRLERTGQPQTKAFLNVDVARRTDDGVRIARFILRDLFAFPADAPLRMSFRNISPHDELIDRLPSEVR